MAKTIVILSDGETWTMADRCSIVVVSDDIMEDLMNGDTTLDEMEVLSEISFKVWE